MDEKSSGKCLEPRLENCWERKRTFFEVAAAQSSLKSVNPNLPDSLVSPLVTVLDPCTLHAAIHTKVDWSLVRSRLVRGHILARKPVRPPVREPSSHPEAPDADGSSDGGGGTSSQCSSPAYPGKNGENRGSSPMETCGANLELSEEAALKRDKDVFIDEIVDLVRNVKKHNDPSLSSSPTWIDRLQVEKVSKQLIMLQNYQPGLLSIDEIVHGLLFEHGPAVMEDILIEMPEHIVVIVNSLIANPTPGNRTRYRNLIIGKIVELYPYFAKRIIYKFAERRSDCVFACRLAVDHMSDKQFLEFLEPMLSEKDTYIHKIVVKMSNRQVLPLVITRLLSMANFVLQAHPDAFPEMGMAPWCTRLSYCLLELMNFAMEPWKELEVVTVTKFVFRTSSRASVRNAPSESESIDEPMDTTDNDQNSQDSCVPDSDPETSQSISRPPQIRPGATIDPSPFGEEHECFVLAALIAVPFLTQYPPNQTGAVQPPDRAVEHWLEVARKRVLIGEKVTTTFGANLIYVHACIMSSRIEELAEFASDLMKQKVELAQRPNHAQVLKNAFTSRCMTEVEVAKRSVCQESSKNSPSSAMALRSVHALQLAGVYKAFQISIKPWLEIQLECIALPCSKLLADIVDGFAQSSAFSKGKGLGKEFVRDTFTGDIFDSRTVPKRLFVLLYMCSFREAAHRHDSSLQHFLYDMSIFRKMPVRYLLSIMDQQRENFEEIRAKIITRVAVIFPFTLPTPLSMEIFTENQKLADLEIQDEEHFGRQRTDQRLKHLKENKDINKVLESINRFGIRDQLSSLRIVINIFMESLKPHTPSGFEQPLVAIFDRYEQLDPFSLFLQSAASWIQHDKGIDVEDVIKIPSLLFRSDPRIFSSPPHFHCFIRTLNFFNKKVRIENRLKTLEIQHKAQASAIQHQNRIYGLELDRKEKELLTGAYLDIQQSVLIHALVEVCDPKRMKDALQSAYKQRKAVLQCERFMKGGACTGVDYSHLLRKIIAKADTTGESPCRLNPEQTFILRSAIHLSDGNMKTAKHIFHNFLGYDVLSSREAVNAIKNDLDTSSNYKIEEVEKDKELGTGRVQKVRTIRITIKSMEQGIRRRLETLDKHGRLINDEDDVILCLLGDKGSDETQLCVSFENTPNPNSPGNLLLVVMYDGQDNKISYTSADGTLVTKNVKKKVLGDMKIVSAYLGHRGHSSSHPCYDCLTPWSLHGTKALKLKDVDFAQIHTIRTLKTYAEDSKSGNNGVKKGSKPLCQVEPTDNGIPTVHVVMGIFIRYFENRINGEVNSMDRKDDQVAKTLREHKKSLAKMVEKETELHATLKKLVSARDDAFCTATAYRLVALNPLAHLKTPEPMCKSTFCVVNHLLRDRTTDNWIQCDVCEEYFHFACCSIFSPDEKLQITGQKSWNCCNCENLDKMKHHTKVLESLKALESEITKISAIQSSVTQKRIDLESLLFKSTGDNRKKLEAFLFSINCDVRSWYQTLGDPTDFSLAEKRVQIRKIACDFIHRTFLDYEGLIKVVLHQRFPLRQVRDLVEGVPALFAGNAQILEMLSLADQDRRFFAIVFAAEICRKYRVRESLETARVVCDIVHSLHKFGELPSSYKLWKHVAPALIILATEFPSLADSINRLLIRVLTTAKNRMAVKSGMFAGDPKQEEYRLIAEITSFLDRNKNRQTL
ncbi:hypothetical protein L5515_009066 [Caenorhabditis briggsae]|uniref:PHD-type domain-containing protein n=1 Tax=Caenorhabditis briggsae TaxID=6238 RepID=A0AAE9F9B2_CAEBR|nr:hypothetical protein L5515_009066 [Caenorhabditis briggsae]